ncbi:ABC transport system ATP-binding protein A1A2 [Thermoplasma volcanium GSS1]|uniref:ABC transport system ATP-binding protein A1A2 n=1 Tax=Thermoplasma volcanium (strain ATCC 51530 / DSM 4299 / JCM 9571 / NBRC 15438 / GSS1) TaxID=273116 RepID=Q97BE5_THEVO|nr:ABC transporter ATP-binding protein [Thermoplasma volcanium]BAB59653.1 ABC transport system ATP-binding protein A1A2 [Thermoplasma volcanium GSS1]
MNEEILPILTVKDLNAGYLTNEKYIGIIHNINIELNRGKIVGITGLSGSGKTTLLKSILLETHIKSGEIIFNGKPIMPGDTKNYRRSVIYVPQNSLDSLDIIWPIEDQVKKILKQHNVVYDINKVSEIAKLIDLDISMLKLKSFEVSYGTRHKIVLLMSILMAKRDLVVLMDEPTLSQDAITAEGILNIIVKLAKDYGSSFIIVSSSPEPVFYASDFIYIMYGGWIVENGTPNDLSKWPKHPFTYEFINMLPAHKTRDRFPKFPMTEFSENGCPYSIYCKNKIKGCDSHINMFGEGHKYRCLNPVV